MVNRPRSRVVASDSVSARRHVRGAGCAGRRSPAHDIEPDDHAPIADPKTGLRAALQPPQVGTLRVLGESPDRAEHPLLDVRVESFEILLSTPFELNSPRLFGHESPCLRMISA
jgi:hypothetical protein